MGGCSDAHSNRMHLGPVKRTIFPYEFHFRTIDTHVLLPRPLGIDAASDADLILDALRQGHCFVGYDLPAPTHGFTFTAQGLHQTAQMGDELDSKGGVTIQIRLPSHGMHIAQGWQASTHLAQSRFVHLHNH